MKAPTGMKRTATTKTRGTRTSPRLSKEMLAEMIEEATVDAYDDSEQATGRFTMFEEHVGQIVAICTRGRDRQAISLVDLPLPPPKPAGTGWIEAYRYWLSRR